MAPRSATLQSGLRAAPGRWGSSDVKAQRGQLTVLPVAVPYRARLEFIFT